MQEDDDSAARSIVAAVDGDRPLGGDGPFDDGPSNDGAPMGDDGRASDDDLHDAGDDEPPSGGGIDHQTVEACAALDQNDTDNGRRMLMHFGRDLVHVREIGWHAFAGTHWDADGGTEAVERMAQETARRIRLEGTHIHPSRRDREIVDAAKGLAGKPDAELTDGERALRDAAAKALDRLEKRRADRRKFSISCGNRSRTVAMIAQALPHRSIAPAEMDRDGMRFNVDNGTLHFLRAVEMVEDLECPDPDVTRLVRRVRVGVSLRPHERGDLISKLAEVTYDPEARCPKWDAFLARFQPDAAQRSFLQTAAGRGLLGGASTQCLIFLWGDGANGKSAFTETLAQLLGAYAGRLKPESISGLTETSGDKATPDFARLAGRRFVAISELPRGVPLREGLIKTMTGGEPMPVRHLNKGFFDLVPEFIPFMSGNDLPEVGGLDHGIWRRLKFVHWPVTLDRAEQRPLQEVVGEFLAEASGILNWLIEGAMRFLEHGLQDPQSVTDATESHRSDLDPVGAFVLACLRKVDHVPGQMGEVQARTMYLAFHAWCEANAVRAWKEAAFGRAMKKKGFHREDKRIRVWTGVELYGVPDVPRSPHGNVSDP